MEKCSSLAGMDILGPLSIVYNEENEFVPRYNEGVKAASQPANEEEMPLLALQHILASTFVIQIYSRSSWGGVKYSVFAEFRATDTC